MKRTAMCLTAGCLFLAATMFSGCGQPGNRGGLDAGEPLPAVTAAGWVNGEPPDLKGKVVVVDAWATWCGPCRQAAPEMVRLHEKFAGDDVVFIGLTQEGEESVPAIESFVESAGITWPNGYGATETLTALDVTYIPAVWVVDRNGKIVWNFESSGTMENAIADAVKQ
ncbi:TlpA family protein disulfide reductase [bacterium]|nr:TlpA family protein disulfide reductase [bacterium]